MVEMPTPPDGYEFNESEEAVIADTARWVRIWAWFAMSGGALMVISGAVNLPDGVASLAIGVVYGVIGVYFLGTGRSLQSVVETRGDDITHLLTALANLRSAFRVMVLVTAIGLVVGVIAGIMGMGA